MSHQREEKALRDIPKECSEGDWVKPCLAIYEVIIRASPLVCERRKLKLKCLSPMTTILPKREINADGTKKSTTTVDSPKCEFPCSGCWVETGVRANSPWAFFRRTERLVSWAWYTCANPCTTKKKRKERKKGSTRRCKEIQAKLGQLTSFRSLSEVPFYIQFFPSCARLRQMIRGDEY